MMKNKPIISICIPAFKRIEILKKTIDSIYADAINSNVELSLFEIVISDNDSEHEIKSLVKTYDYPNMYYHQTDCEGFMNSYYVLRYAKGAYLKLLNSQSCFKLGTLSKMIRLVQECYYDRKVILMTNGMLGKKDIHEYDTFNQFMQTSSYYTSWSNGFGIWKDDFEKLPNIPLNDMFPHTSISFYFCENKKYVIDDRILFDIQRIKKKGGHNMFKSFSIDYTSLLRGLYEQNYITKETYNNIRKDLIYKFFPHLFFKNQILKIDNYEYKGFKKNLKQNFPFYAYYMILILGVLYPLLNFKRIIKK